MSLSQTHKREEVLPQENSDEESQDMKLERLGRERPPIFKNIWRELAFVFSICMCQVLTEFYVSGFIIVLPTVIQELNIPEAASVWPTTAFSLVVASTLLVFGRLGDMWGGYPILLWGLAWLVLWSIIAGFSVNSIMLDICRALQGLGAAAFLPTSIMIFGSVYRPGPRKNFIFSIYGACAVLGFYLGIFVAGLVGQYLRWGYFFWFGAILTGLTFMTSIFSVPNDRRERQLNKVKMDWWGAITTVSGLVLVVTAITESAHAEKGWRTPYIAPLFCVGVILLLIAVYVEAWVAEEPLLCPSIFKTPHMTPLVLALFLIYGAIGIYMLYGTQYFMNIMGVGSLQVVAWYTPAAIGGLILSVTEGLLLHLVSAHLLLCVAGVGAIGSQLLLALIPNHGTYWTWVFTSMICLTISIDLSYTILTVFVTTNMPKARQGQAGSLINASLQLGIALVLGFSDIIQTYTKEEQGLQQSYKNTFWFGVALAALSLVIVTIWGGIPRAKSDLTADEKAELEKELNLSS